MEAAISESISISISMSLPTSTAQLPSKIPQIPSNRDYKALNRGTLGDLGTWTSKVPKILDIIPK